MLVVDVHRVSSIGDTEAGMITSFMYPINNDDDNNNNKFVCISFETAINANGAFWNDKQQRENMNIAKQHSKCVDTVATSTNSNRVEIKQRQ